MRRFAAFAGVLLALTGAGAPAHAFPLSQRAPILTPGACANALIDIDFTAANGAGLYCLNGTRYSRLADVPGATFTRSSSKTCTRLDGTIVTAPPGVPCITDQGILIEGASTNEFGWSQDQSNSAWQQADTIATANAATAPDGATTAAAINGDGANNYHFVAQSGSTSSATHCVSGYLKNNTNPYIRVESRDWSTWTNGAHVYLDLGAGSVGSSGADGTGSGVSASITPAANGWYRFGLCYSTSGAAVAGIRIAIAQSMGGTTFWSTTGGFYSWGVQIESGVTFISSLVPTTSSGATRAADVASISGVSIPSTGYTMQVNYLVPYANDTNYRNMLEVGDGTSNNRTDVGNLSLSSYYEMDVGGATQAAFGSTFPTPFNTLIKSAFGVSGGRQVPSLNGALTTALAGALLNSGTRSVLIGRDVFARVANAYLKQIVVLPIVLPDAQIQARTR